MYINRDEVNVIRANRKELIKIYHDSPSPKDTVDSAIESLGKDVAIVTVANLVNGIGDWDGRLSTKSRMWARSVEGSYSRETLIQNHIYNAQDIHPAHLNQIAEEIIKRNI